MIELLKEIPGPYFLILYSGISILVVLIAKLIVENDYTRDLEIPEPTKLSPLEIAYLTRGLKGAVIVSIFNLWRNKQIEINKIDNNIALKQISFDYTGLNKLETTILKYSHTQKFYSGFFKKESINTSKKILLPVKEKLEKLKLLADASIVKRNWTASSLSIIILLLLGGTKLFLGLSRDKPVGFLFILILLSICAVIFILKPYNVHLTSLGKKFIKTSSKRFEWLKSNDNNAVMTDDNLLFGISLFGISSFMNTGMGDMLENPYLLEKNAGTNSGTGCSGAGCGGGGGGSGCGGGSSCGGGCGGCGGGD